MNKIGGLLCIVGVIFGCAAMPLVKQQSAGITVLSQSESEMGLRLVNAKGFSYQLDLIFDAEINSWHAVSTGVPGIVFGNEQLVFARPVQLRALNISTAEAIQPMSSAIAERPMDDVTVARLIGGEMAVALWQDGVVTELWIAAGFYEELLHPDFAGWNFCERGQQLCCETIDNPNPFGPTKVPRPRVSSCGLVAVACPDRKDAVCDCLAYACDFCFNHWDYCDDEAYPWLPEDSEAACDAGLQYCVEHPDDDDGFSILIDEIANRLQAVIDIQNANIEP